MLQGANLFISAKWFEVFLGGRISFKDQYMEVGGEVENEIDLFHDYFPHLQMNIDVDSEMLCRFLKYLELQANLIKKTAIACTSASVTPFVFSRKDTYEIIGQVTNKIGPTCIERKYTKQGLPNDQEMRYFRTVTNKNFIDIICLICEPARYNYNTRAGIAFSLGACISYLGSLFRAENSSQYAFPLFKVLARKLYDFCAECDGGKNSKILRSIAGDNNICQHIQSTIALKYAHKTYPDQLKLILPKAWKSLVS